MVVAQHYEACEGVTGRVDSHQPFARFHEILDGLLGCFSPARAVVVEHQDIVSGQRRLRDSHRLFFHPNVKAPASDQSLPQKGRCGPPIVVVPPGKDEDANRSWLEERNRHLRGAIVRTEQHDWQQNYEFG